MKNLLKIIKLPITHFLMSSILCIQVSFAGDDSFLKPYILEGLSNNLDLAQQKFNLQSADLSVNEARSKFLPSVTFQARYSKSTGGRSIDLPVGSLLNPVYRNLDVINRGTLPPYPTISDVSVGLLPTDDQETKFQLIQPLFVPSIPANYRLQKHLRASVAANIKTEERSLIKEIRIAYYTCLQAQDAVRVYTASLQRSVHQRNSAEKLNQAGMLNTAGLLVTQADVSSAEVKYQQALADLKTAKRAFNLILNRDIEAELDLTSPDSAFITFIFQKDLTNTTPFESLALSKRSELHAIKESISATVEHSRIEKSSMMPTLGASVEGGFVGEKYDFTKKSGFITGSALLQWQIFSGTERLQKIHKAILSENQLRKLYTETTAKIIFQIRKICQDLSIAKSTCNAADKQLIAAEKNYETVLKRYELGEASSTEMTDASTLLTNANANQSISRYNLFIKDAELRFALSDDTLEQYHAIKRENTDETDD